MFITVYPTTKYHHINAKAYDLQHTHALFGPVGLRVSASHVISCLTAMGYPFGAIIYIWRSHNSRWLLIRILLLQSLCTLSHSPNPSCSIVAPGLCRPGVGSCPSAGERLMAYLGLAPAWGKPNHRSTCSFGSPHANETTNC